MNMSAMLVGDYDDVAPPCIGSTARVRFMVTDSGIGISQDDQVFNAKLKLVLRILLLFIEVETSVHICLLVCHRNFYFNLFHKLIQLKISPAREWLFEYADTRVLTFNCHRWEPLVFDSFLQVWA